MTDEAPFRIILQVAVVGGTHCGTTAIATVCEGRWFRCRSNEFFQEASRRILTLIEELEAEGLL